MPSNLFLDDCLFIAIKEEQTALIEGRNSCLWINKTCLCEEKHLKRRIEASQDWSKLKILIINRTCTFELF